MNSILLLLLNVLPAIVLAQPLLMNSAFNAGQWGSGFGSVSYVAGMMGSGCGCSPCGGGGMMSSSCGCSSCCSSVSHTSCGCAPTVVPQLSYGVGYIPYRYDVVIPPVVETIVPEPIFIEEPVVPLVIPPPVEIPPVACCPQPSCSQNVQIISDQPLLVSGNRVGSSCAGAGILPNVVPI